MIYLLLIIIIVLLVYIVFFTPEKREKRKIKRIQNLFNTPLYTNAEEFFVDDEKNNTEPNEIVKYGLKYMTRKDALLKLKETRKLFPNLDESQIEVLSRTRF